ncbi:MAG: phytanoyl-CoA dioxygenase family protein [Steroidobacteraceae bacterium]
MPSTSILTREQLDEFDRRGVLRLVALLSADRVRRAREHVQRRLAPPGLWREGAWHLQSIPRPQWPATGLKTSKVIGNKHPDVQALVEEPALLAAVDALLGGRAFDRTAFRRPQILLTLPNSDTWMVPTEWHVDSPRLASGRRSGVQLFTFLDTVEPRGGGTLVIPGSHRLLNDGRFIRAQELRRLLCREAFFRQLCSRAPASADDRARLLDQGGAVGDVALELVELTGAPGDAYLTDLRVLHSGAPNAADRPRMMATHRFVLADVMQELTEAQG